MNGLKIAGISVLAVTLLLGISFGGQALDLWSLNFWGPKYANAERNIYENTQSYVAGKRTRISSMRLEYEKADKGPVKEALRREILTEADGVDTTKLPADMQLFINQLREEN